METTYVKRYVNLLFKTFLKKKGPLSLERLPGLKGWKILDRKKRTCGYIGETFLAKLNKKK